jgi:retron-type reverse transcriptase
MVLLNMLRGRRRSQPFAYPSIANRYLRETSPDGGQRRSREPTVELRSVSSATPSALANST